MEKRIELSIIIPTRNRADLLQITLASIAKQTLEQTFFEVIVCDNNSTDNTAEVASTFSSTFRNFKYVKTREPGLHVGRNKGMQEANGDIVVYIDDDIEALPTWLEGIWESFQNAEVVLVGGNDFPKYEITPPLWVESLWNYNQFGKWNGHYSLIDFGSSVKEIDPNYVFGCNFAIRKNIIVELGGFHPDGMPRDKIKYRGDGESYISKMILEKGLKTIFNPKASLYHFVPKSRMTKEYLYHRGFIQGISDSYTQFRVNKLQQIEQVLPKKEKKEGVITRIISFLMLRNVKNDIISIKSKLVYKESIFMQEFYTGHKDGYTYHQNELKIDEALQNWVVKENYL